MVWIVGAVRLAAGDIERGRTEGTARFGQLAEARILAQQARTDETLQLITRGDITASEKSFYGHIDELVARIGTGVAGSCGGRREVGRRATACRWTPTGPATTRARSRRRSAPIPAHRAHSSPSSSRACATRSNTPEPRCAITCRTPAAISLWLPTGALVLMTVAAVAAVVGLVAAAQGVPMRTRVVVVLARSSPCCSPGVARRRRHRRPCRSRPHR